MPGLVPVERQPTASRLVLPWREGGLAWSDSGDFSRRCVHVASSLR
jgi:hypothetical protein